MSERIRVVFEIEISDTILAPDWRNQFRWIDSCIRAAEKPESGVKLLGYHAEDGQS